MAKIIQKSEVVFSTKKNGQKWGNILITYAILKMADEERLHLQELAIAKRLDLNEICGEF